MDGLSLIEKDIRGEIDFYLRRSGIMYRLFSRIKDQNSIDEKLVRKSYESSGKLMQDVIGYRITTYFNDDIRLLVEFFCSHMNKVSLEYDEPKANEFNPLRKNLICKFSTENTETFNELKNTIPSFKFIDTTFEVQFRTTLSEGWHEVEHNMRYKCKDEWATLDHESRMLNGIYASLEASDYNLKGMFDDISYTHYKNKNWEGMLRNKFRLRFILSHLSSDISAVFNNEPEIPKLIFKIPRLEIIKVLLYSDIKLQLSFNNIVFLCNHMYVKNEAIAKLAPSIILDELKLIDAMPIDISNQVSV